MIGIGTWMCHVDTMLFKGDAKIKIYDNGGQYGFDLDVKDIDIPDIDVKDIVEDGDTLTATATTSMLPGKEIPITLTFDGDTVEGSLKVPFVGKVKLKNGRKIAD